MLSLFIEISYGLLTILSVVILRLADKKTIYGVILSGIGFLYVGFTWSDLPAFVINAVQAIVFVIIAYYGIKKNVNILAGGYFLHGCWDIAYDFISDPGLIPPHYDWFCSSLDFTIGAYILLFSKQFLVNKISPEVSYAQ